MTLRPALASRGGPRARSRVSAARGGRRARSSFDVPALPGARRARLPASLSPQLATLVKEAPEGEEWLHEIKLDGYRVMARLQDGELRLLTRGGLDWTGSFPGPAEALRALPVAEAFLDGEMVALARDGTSDFQALHGLLGSADPRLVYQVFDLPFCAGQDLRKVPLLERKRLLRALLEAAPADPRLRFSEHIQGRGPESHRQACSYALEGIISKRADCPYQSGRNRSWLKVKCVLRQELVIGGWTPGARGGFGALLLGYHDEQGRLVYSGKVGTGFTAASLRQLLPRLESRQTREIPFQVQPPRGREARQARWVKPELVAEVEFLAWTEDGLLRHPSFQGLREDKPAAEVRREEPVAAPAAARRSRSVAAPPSARQRRQPAAPRRPEPSTEVVRRLARLGVKLSNPDRVVYTEPPISKAALASYYLSVEKLMLPHLGKRPLSVVRCPRGQAGHCFYQKHHHESGDGPIKSVLVKEHSRREPEPQLLIDSSAGLLALIQLGVLEIHPWGCRADRVEQPDLMVFDLDPGPELAWPAVLEAAVEVRGRLAQLGLESFVKTSGGKGLHVQLPLRRGLSWDEHRAFAQAIAEDLARRRPQRYVAVMSKARRRGRIFVDYLRNSRGATSVAAYSTRARPGAPVSTPLSWEELPSLSAADAYTALTLPARLAELAEDPWAGYFELRQSLTVKMRRALGLS